MRRSLNRQQLRYCIFTVKNTIEAFNRRWGRKLVFLNDLCLYDHIRRLPLAVVEEEHGRRFAKSGLIEKSPQTVSDLLDMLEPYIPLSLNDANFDLFLRAAEDMPHIEEELPDYFKQKARIDFVAALWRAEGFAAMEWLLNVCEAVRDLKGEMERAGK